MVKASLSIVFMLAFVGCAHFANECVSGGHVNIESAQVYDEGEVAVRLKIINNAEADFDLLCCNGVYPELDIQVFSVDGCKLKTMYIGGVNCFAGNDCSIIPIRAGGAMELFIFFNIAPYESGEELILSVLSPFDASLRSILKISHMHVAYPAEGKGLVPYPRIEISEIYKLKQVNAIDH